MTLARAMVRSLESWSAARDGAAALKIVSMALARLFLIPGYDCDSLVLLSLQQESTGFEKSLWRISIAAIWQNRRCRNT